MSTTESNSIKNSDNDRFVIDKIYAALRERYIDAALATLIQQKFKEPFALSALSTNVIPTTNSNINIVNSHLATQPGTVQLTPQGIPLAQTSVPQAQLQSQHTSLLQTATDWSESESANTLLNNNSNNNNSAFCTNVSNTHVALVLLEMLMKCDSGTYNGDLLSSANQQKANNNTTVEFSVQNDTNDANNINTEQVINLHSTLAHIVLSMTNNIVEYLNKNLQSGSYGVEDIVATLDSYSVPVSLLRSGNYGINNNNNNNNTSNCTENNTNVNGNRGNVGDDNVRENIIEFDELGSGDNSFNCNEEDENSVYMNYAAINGSHGYDNPSDSTLDNEETQRHSKGKRHKGNEQENPLLLASQCLFLITRHFQLSADSVMDIVKLEYKILERVNKESYVLCGGGGGDNDDEIAANMKYNKNVNSSYERNSVNSIVTGNHTATTSTKQNAESVLPWYCYHNRQSLVFLYKERTNAQLLSLMWCASMSIVNALAVWKQFRNNTNGLLEKSNNTLLCQDEFAKAVTVSLQSLPQRLHDTKGTRPHMPYSSLHQQEQEQELHHLTHKSHHHHHQRKHAHSVENTPLPMNANCESLLWERVVWGHYSILLLSLGCFLRARNEIKGYSIAYEALFGDSDINMVTYVHNTTASPAPSPYSLAANNSSNSNPNEGIREDEDTQREEWIHTINVNCNARASQFMCMGKATKRMVQLAPVRLSNNVNASADNNNNNTMNVYSFKLPAEMVYVVPYELLSFMFDFMVDLFRKVASAELSSNEEYLSNATELQRIASTLNEYQAEFAQGSNAGMANSISLLDTYKNRLYDGMYGVQYDIAGGSGNRISSAYMQAMADLQNWLASQTLFTSVLPETLQSLSTCLSHLPPSVLMPDLDSDCAATFFTFVNCVVHLRKVFEIEKEHKNEVINYYNNNNNNNINNSNNVGANEIFDARTVANTTSLESTYNSNNGSSNDKDAQIINTTNASLWMPFTLKLVSNFLEVLTRMLSNTEYQPRVMELLSNAQQKCRELRWSNLIKQALACAGLSVMGNSEGENVSAMELSNSGVGTRVNDYSSYGYHYNNYNNSTNNRSNTTSSKPTCIDGRLLYKQYTLRYHEKYQFKFIDALFGLLRELCASRTLHGTIADYLTLPSALVFLNAPHQSFTTLSSTLSLIASLIKNDNDARLTWFFLINKQLLQSTDIAKLSSAEEYNRSSNNVNSSKINTSSRRNLLLIAHDDLLQSNNNNRSNKKVMHALLSLLCRLFTFDFYVASTDGLDIPGNTVNSSNNVYNVEKEEWIKAAVAFESAQRKTLQAVTRYIAKYMLCSVLYRNNFRSLHVATRYSLFALAACTLTKLLENLMRNSTINVVSEANVKQSTELSSSSSVLTLGNVLMLENTLHNVLTEITQLITRFTQILFNKAHVLWLESSTRSTYNVLPDAVVNVRSPQRHALRQSLQLLLTSLHLSIRDLQDTHINNNISSSSTNYDRITLTQHMLSSEEFGLKLLSLLVLLLPQRDNDKKESVPQRPIQQQLQEQQNVNLHYHDGFDVTLTSILVQLLMNMPPTTLTLTCVKMKTWPVSTVQALKNNLAFLLFAQTNTSLLPELSSFCLVENECVSESDISSPVRTESVNTSTHRYACKLQRAVQQCQSLLLDLLLQYAAEPAPSLTSVLCGMENELNEQVMLRELHMYVLCAIVYGAVNVDLEEENALLSIKFVKLLHSLQSNVYYTANVLRTQGIMAGSIQSENYISNGMQHLFLRLLELQPGSCTALQLIKYSYALRMLTKQVYDLQNTTFSSWSNNLSSSNVHGASANVIASLSIPLEVCALLYWGSSTWKTLEKQQQHVEQISNTHLSQSSLLSLDALSSKLLRTWPVHVLAQLPPFPTLQFPYKALYASHRTYLAEDKMHNTLCFNITTLFNAFNAEALEKTSNGVLTDVEMKAKLLPFVHANACYLHYTAVTKFLESWKEFVIFTASMYIKQISQEEEQLEDKKEVVSSIKSYALTILQLLDGFNWELNATQTSRNNNNNSVRSNIVNGNKLLETITREDQERIVSTLLSTLAHLLMLLHTSIDLVGVNETYTKNKCVVMLNDRIDRNSSNSVSSPKRRRSVRSSVVNEESDHRCTSRRSNSAINGLLKRHENEQLRSASLLTESEANQGNLFDYEQTHNNNNNIKKRSVDRNAAYRQAVCGELLPSLLKIILHWGSVFPSLRINLYKCLSSICAIDETVLNDDMTLLLSRNQIFQFILEDVIMASSASENSVCPCGDNGVHIHYTEVNANAQAALELLVQVITQSEIWCESFVTERVVSITTSSTHSNSSSSVDKDKVQFQQPLYFSSRSTRVGAMVLSQLNTTLNAFFNFNERSVNQVHVNLQRAVDYLCVISAHRPPIALIVSNLFDMWMALDVWQQSSLIIMSSVATINSNNGSSIINSNLWVLLHLFASTLKWCNQLLLLRRQENAPIFKKERNCHEPCLMEVRTMSVTTPHVLIAKLQEFVRMQRVLFEFTLRKLPLHELFTLELYDHVSLFFAQLASCSLIVEECRELVQEFNLPQFFVLLAHQQQQQQQQEFPLNTTLKFSTPLVKSTNAILSSQAEQLMSSILCNIAHLMLRSEMGAKYEVWECVYAMNDNSNNNNNMIGQEECTTIVSHPDQVCLIAQATQFIAQHLRHQLQKWFLVSIDEEHRLFERITRENVQLSQLLYTQCTMHERTLLTLQALVTLIQHFIVKNNTNTNTDNNNAESNNTMPLTLFDETLRMVNVMNEELLVAIGNLQQEIKYAKYCRINNNGSRVTSISPTLSTKAITSTIMNSNEKVLYAPSAKEIRRLLSNSPHLSPSRSDRAANTTPQMSQNVESSSQNKFVQGVSATATPNINVVADQDALMKSNLMRNNAQNAASYENINSINVNNNINISDTKSAARQRGENIFDQRTLGNLYDSTLMPNPSRVLPQPEEEESDKNNGSNYDSGFTTYRAQILEYMTDVIKASRQLQFALANVIPLTKKDN